MMLRWIGQAEQMRKVQAARIAWEARQAAQKAKRRAFSERLRDFADGLLAMVAVVFPFGF